jgi:L-tartrate/succinate antiporter
MFLTGMAPNVLALSLAGKVANVSISWTDWVVGFAPVGVILIALLPIALYKLFPPHIKHAPEAPAWAKDQLRAMGPISRAEVMLLALVLTALALWIGGGGLIDPTIVAMLVVALMLVTRVLTWEQVIGNADAWNVLVWFATLVTLAGGLAETGFVRWIAESIAPLLSTLDRNTAIVCLVATFFLLHYFFASITAHTATLFSMFLAVAIQTGTASAAAWTLLLGYSLGMMGILTPYASGQNAVYYGSGYITRKQFWALGFVVGTLFLATYLVIIIPWLTWLGI